MNTDFFDSKKDKELITQISHAEWIQLLAMILNDIDIESLINSPKKADRVTGRKLYCLATLGIKDPSKLRYLMVNLARWETLYFRKQGIDRVSVEVA